MTARAEIENVLGRASWGYDENDVDLIAAQFTETPAMTLQIGRDGDTIGPFEGRERSASCTRTRSRRRPTSAGTTSPT